MDTLSHTLSRAASSCGARRGWPRGAAVLRRRSSQAPRRPRTTGHRRDIKRGRTDSALVT